MQAKAIFQKWNHFWRMADDNRKYTQRNCDFVDWEIPTVMTATQ